MNDKAGFESGRDGNLAPFPSFTKRRLLLASLLHSLLEKEMATHSIVGDNSLAWRIPRMAETGGLPSSGSHRVGYD